MAEKSNSLATRMALQIYHRL